MKTKRSTLIILSVIAGLLVVGLIIFIIGPTRLLRRIPVAVPASLDEKTSMQDFDIVDFDAVHAPIGEDSNEYLIFGNLPVSQPDADISPDLAAFLGRWEGYSYAPPVKKDWKFVLVIQEITAEGGKAFLWMGTNLQYPSEVKEIAFRVVPGDPPSIESVYEANDTRGILTFAYDPDQELLRGQIEISLGINDRSAIELSHDRSFTVYKDYAQYLEGKRIYAKTYRDTVLTSFYGNGYLVYLPEGYEANDSQQTWPLLIFLHGSGDRGDNVFLLAKASPFMMIREKGPLPFIIVAPLLSASEEYDLFPDNYLTGMLEEILADYRVDQTRIYATGLSIGGDATYRFALLQPDTFAAIAPLAAFLYPPQDMESLKDLPVWAIHGADDIVIPLRMAQKPVDALKQAGNDVRFTVLENHDHDVWTDTYSDPQFYEWLLQHKRP
ncbi:MAG: hypothetical protein JXB07_20030 [Anaerolineae bacterium]|nr:hypothetical protein [Anaerolineae bacterium]